LSFFFVSRLHTCYLKIQLRIDFFRFNFFYKKKSSKICIFGKFLYNRFQLSLKIEWKCLWLQKIDDFFQEIIRIVKVLQFRSSLCQPIRQQQTWLSFNITSYLIPTNKDVEMNDTTSLFVWIDLCVRFERTKVRVFLFNHKIRWESDELLQ